MTAVCVPAQHKIYFVGQGIVPATWFMIQKNGIGIFRPLNFRQVTSNLLWIVGVVYTQYAEFPKLDCLIAKYFNTVNFNRSYSCLQVNITLMVAETHPGWALQIRERPQVIGCNVT